ncbi:bacterial regulatory helix-turn-helix protein, lysR family protein [Shigella flexneri 4343-70]|nr:bacterial regulatory helix-turn-helix protein, lysR family protein [Shigella flexneri 4343-70]
MDDCGAVLHNIETKWLYDFLTLEKCRNFSQAAVSRNVSQPAFSRRIRALEQAIGVELFNRQVTPLQLSEQGKIFHSQIRHLLQQLESNLAELRGGGDYAQRKIKIAAAHSLSLGLLPSIISQMPPLFTWAIEAIDVDEAVDKLREGQSDCIFPFTTKICWKRRLTTFAYLNLNCSLSAPVTNTEKHFLTSRSHTFRY